MTLIPEAYGQYALQEKGYYPLAAAVLRLVDEDWEGAIGWASVMVTEHRLRTVDRIDVWRAAQGIPSVWG